MMNKLANFLMKTLSIDIGLHFSKTPRGRFYTDGPSSGEKFREELLRKRLSELPENEILDITIDDVEGYGSSFLVEGFAGIVKYGYMKREELLKKINIKYSDPDFEFYKKKIEQYINEAEFNSKKYTPSV